MNYYQYHNQFRFPDGTLSVKLRNPRIDYEGYIALSGFSVDELLAKHDCIRQTGYTGPINLFAPYLPARQDRVCSPGEPFTAKIVANLINSLEFNRVVTLEPHSDVISGLLNRLVVLSYRDVFDFHSIPIITRPARLNLIAPDAGATKRTEKFAQSVLNLFPNKEIRIIQGLKKRNLLTGEILEIKIADNENLEGEDCLVVDDVCAMGGTFKGIYHALKKNNAGKINLILAHADMKNGLDNLADLYDNIYVTNSQPFEVESKNVFVTDIFK